MRGHLALLMACACVGAGARSWASDEKAAGDAATPNLTGRWKLDPEKSDDAHAKMKEAWAGHHQGGTDPEGGGSGSKGEPGGGMGGGHRGGGMGGGHMGGGHMGGGHMGGGRGPGGGMSDESRVAMRSLMEGLMEPAKVLTITEAEGEIAMAADDGRTLHLRADGKKVKDEGGNLERKTKWDGGQLVTEVAAGSGPKITESWSLAPDGKAMEATVRLALPMSDKPVVIKRVYLSAPPE